MRNYLRYLLVVVVLAVPLSSCAGFEEQIKLRNQISELQESNKRNQITLVAIMSANTLAKEFDRLLDDLIATDLNKDQWFGIEPYITDGQTALHILDNEKSTQEEIAKANVQFKGAMVGMRRWHARIFPERIVPVIPTFEPEPTS